MWPLVLERVRTSRMEQYTDDPEDARVIVAVNLGLLRISSATEMHMSTLDTMSVFPVIARPSFHALLGDALLAAVAMR